MQIRRNMLRLTFAILVVFVVGDAKASKVMKVSKSGKFVVVSQGKKRKWKKGDIGCIYNNKKKKVTCGRITKRNKKAAVLRIRKTKKDIEKGFRVVARKKKRKSKVKLMGRKPAANTMRSETGATGKPKSFQKNTIALGASAGFNHLYPMLHYQRALSRKLALGIAPLFLSASVDTTTVSALGGFLTGTFYMDKPFDGIFGQLGLGMYLFSASQDNGSLGVATDSDSSLALMLMAGYRKKLKNGINFGGGLGIQYVVQPTLTLVDIEFANIQPTLNLEVGYTF